MLLTMQQKDLHVMMLVCLLPKKLALHLAWVSGTLCYECFLFSLLMILYLCDHIPSVFKVYTVIRAEENVDQSNFMGMFNFDRCGFLGLLHMDVFHQRLEQVSWHFIDVQLHCIGLSDVVLGSMVFSSRTCKLFLKLNQRQQYQLPSGCKYLAIVLAYYTHRMCIRFYSAHSVFVRKSHRLHCTLLCV